MPNPYIMAPGLLHAYPVSGTPTSCHEGLPSSASASREGRGAAVKPNLPPDGQADRAGSQHELKLVTAGQRTLVGKGL